MDEPRTILTAARVRGAVEQHRNAMESLRDEMGAANAMYLTRFWPWYANWGKRLFKDRWRYERTGEETEDNRIQKEVDTYNAALFQRVLRTLVKTDPQGRGDPKVKAAVLNALWSRFNMSEIVRDGSQMAILLHGSGYKVGIEAGTGSPLERIYLDAIPPWELVLDRDMTSRKAERYRGHLYQTTADSVREKYGKAMAERGIRDIKGTPRVDYLWDNASLGGAAANAAGGSAANGEADEDGYVTVLELCNFVDSVRGASGRMYKGRLEIWILDQPGLSESPISITPLPFAGPDGQPDPHIFPLGYMHEPSYPFRAHPPAARLVPLQIALNRLQSQMMRDVQRNQRKAIGREGALSQDQMDNLNDGVDRNTALTKDDRPLTDIYYQIPSQPISADTVAFRNTIDVALTRQGGPSQNAMGNFSQGNTAHEVATIQLYTEQGLKYDVALLLNVLSQVSAAMIRAVIVAGVDVTDSVGGEVQDGSAVAPLGIVNDGTAESTGPDIAENMAAASIPTSGWAAFPIEDEGDTFEVTREALDGITQVTFLQSERTPITDSAILQWLTGGGSKQYMELYALMLKGGPIGVIAEAMMEQIAERGELPRSLHPAQLRQKVAEEAEKNPQPPPEETPEAPPEPGNAPPEAQNAPEMPKTPTKPALGDPRAGVAMGLLSEAHSALREAVSRDPGLKEGLATIAMGLVQTRDAITAGDWDSAKQSIIATSQLLSGIEDPIPELDVVRSAMSKLTRAIAADTMPRTRAMDVQVGPEGQP